MLLASPPYLKCVSSVEEEEEEEEEEQEEKEANIDFTTGIMGGLSDYSTSAQ